MNEKGDEIWRDGYEITQSKSRRNLWINGVYKEDEVEEISQN